MRTGIPRTFSANSAVPGICEPPPLSTRPAGNITHLPPAGNSPRYPLVMAEVDEKRLALRKNTVTLIDGRPENADFNYQLSNFSLFENRETHALELFLTTYGQEPGQENWMNADSWHYALQFP